MDESGFSLDTAEICIVGLGLMGGSLALALRPRGEGISAVDPNPDVAEFAVKERIVERASQSLTEVLDADIIILAAPMRTIIGLIGEVGKLAKRGALILDMGSVKTPVVEVMNQLPDHLTAVAGHPMCGREVAGITNADNELFENTKFVICPTNRTTPQSREIALKLIRQIGAVPVEMTAEHHDHAVAAISGLPYVVSAGLALTAGKHAEADPYVWKLAASGFRDTSRLAGSDPVMMRDILLTNRDAVLGQIHKMQTQLDRLAAAVEAGDENELFDLLREVQQQRLNWEESQQK